MTAGMVNQKKYTRFPLICVANACLGTVTNMSKMMFETRVPFFSLLFLRFATANILNWGMPSCMWHGVSLGLFRGRGLSFFRFGAWHFTVYKGP